MALIFIDGFDHYDDNQIVDKWEERALSSIASGGRFGSGYILSCSNHSAYARCKFPARNELFFGFAFKQNQIAHSYTTGSPQMKFRAPDHTTHVNMYCHVDGKMYFTDAAFNVLGSTSYVFTAAQWAYVEVRIKVHPTAGELEVRVNEQVVLNLTNVDTQSGSDNTMGRLEVAGVYYNKTSQWDDFYIDDSQFHGNCRVRTFQPDADSGTHADFTRSAGAADYECVDEEVTNEDTDYIYSLTKGHKSAFGITTGAIGVVKGIQLAQHIKAATSGVRRIKALIRSGGADYNGPVSPVIPADYTYFTNIFDADPQDSNPWNQTKLEAAEFGLTLLDATTTTSTSTTSTTTTT